MIPAASLKSSCLWKCFPNSEGAERPLLLPHSARGCCSRSRSHPGGTARAEQVSSRAGMRVPCLVLTHQLVGCSGKHMEMGSSAGRDRPRAPRGSPCP